MSAKKKLLDVISEVLSTGRGDPNDLANKLADAIEAYVKEVLTKEASIYIPPTEVVINVIGQATGMKNPNPIKLKVEV